MEIIRFPKTLDPNLPFVQFRVNERTAGAIETFYAINLFMPTGFATTDAGNYGGLETGMTGGAVNAVLKNVGINTQGNAELTSSDVAAAASQYGPSAIAGQFGIGGLDVVARKAALEKGVAVNPNILTTYDGHQIRSYQFDFKLVPESAQDSKVVQKIVDVFRNYSLPEKIGALSIQYPATFDIEFFKGEKPNSFMPKILTCYLTSLGVTTNATTNIMHADGAPLETDISLQFQETKSITRQDIYGESFEGIDNPSQVPGGNG